MRILIFLFLVIFQNDSFGQIEMPKINDILYVNTKSGLKLRNKPNSEKHIDIIQFGESIQFIENSGYTQVKENRTGNWMKVEYNNQKGNIFSGYVSRTKPLEYKSEKYDCHDLDYLRDWIATRLDLDSIVYSGKKIKYVELDEERGKFYIDWAQYDDGTTITEIMGYEYYNHIYETYSIGPNDILNMIDYYVFNKNKNCTDDKYYNRPKVISEFHQNGSLKSIESSELGGLRIEILNLKTVIEISYEM